jgi:hypothetical protein
MLLKLNYTHLIIEYILFLISFCDLNNHKKKKNTKAKTKQNKKRKRKRKGKEKPSRQVGRYLRPLVTIREPRLDQRPFLRVTPNNLSDTRREMVGPSF